MKAFLYRHRIFFILCTVIIGWAIFFYLVPPDVLVDKIGVKNSYLISFLVAVIAGFSSITGTSLYATLAVLSNGGASPLILGLVGGLGLFISDSLFYYILSRWRDHITKIIHEWGGIFKKLQYYIRIFPDWVVYSFVFAYIAFAPIPNDILLAVLAVSGYYYRQLFLFILIGDVTMTLILTYFTQ